MKIVLDVNEIIRLYEVELLPVSTIAKKFNVNHGTITLRLKKAGIRLRSQKENQLLVMNRPEVKEKVSKASKKASKQRQETNLKKYGHVVPASGKEKKKEWKKRHLEEHGVIWPNQRNDVREKYKNTCEEKYGVDNVSKTDNVKDLIKKNRWENKSDEELQKIWEKNIKTWKKNLNVNNPLKNKDVAHKVKSNRWDNKIEDELIQIQRKSEETRIKNLKPEIIRKLSLLKIELLDDFNNVTDFVKVKCNKCGNEYETVLDYLFHGYGLCPICFPKNSSTGEREVRDFIKSFIKKENIILNSRQILPSSKEIDVFIRNKNIAFEFNGIYYHSDKFNSDYKYHLNKLEECNKLGIKLIHIFEDEWVYKQDIVKYRIKQILGLGDSIRIHGRKCIIKEIDSETKNNFLDRFHIQGKDNSSIKLGAFYNNELVSVMTFAKGNIAKGSISKEGIWELNRFCSDYNYHIPGIASKLLHYFKNNYEWKEIFSYADRRWSDGNLYYRLGFTLDSVTKPNYWYVKGMNRIHRFNLRKRPDEPKEISEWILRQNEGYYRIWDCGNLKFILN